MEIIKWYTGEGELKRINYKECTRNALIRLDALDIETLNQEAKKVLLNRQNKESIELGLSTSKKVGIDIRVSADDKLTFDMELRQVLDYIIINTY